VPRGRLLVVDDETHILKVIETRMSSAGYEVHVAEDGEVAYRLAQAIRPDLIISDYQMPHMGGLELCTRIAQHRELSGVPIILVTAKGFDLTQEEMSGRQIRKMIAKPFSPREMLAAVDEILENACVGQR
jgi:DNA-binding response OmpR family regulator